MVDIPHSIAIRMEAAIRTSLDRVGNDSNVTATVKEARAIIAELDGRRAKIEALAERHGLTVEEVHEIAAEVGHD